METTSVTAHIPAFSVGGTRREQFSAGRKGEEVIYPGNQGNGTVDRVTLNSKDLEDPSVKAEIARLKAVEAKVKAHEAAHKAAGGAMTGAVSYTYTQGPDGKRYISGGEVSIDTSGGNTPSETITRMEAVRRAALAPADPSSQDRAVAAAAEARIQQARQDQVSSTDESGQASDQAGSAASGQQHLRKMADRAYGENRATEDAIMAVTGKNIGRSLHSRFTSISLIA